MSEKKWPSKQNSASKHKKKGPDEMRDERKARVEEKKMHL